MNLSFFKKITVFVFAVLACLTCSATTYYGKTIGYLRGADSRPCTLFQLVGVDNAGNTNYPWFALPESHTQYDKLFSLLLAAKMSGAPVDVSVVNPTDAADETVCGHAAVSVIGIQ